MDFTTESADTERNVGGDERYAELLQSIKKSYKQQKQKRYILKPLNEDESQQLDIRWYLQFHLWCQGVHKASAQRKQRALIKSKAALESKLNDIRSV